jgi:leucine dehydrogenase
VWDPTAPGDRQPDRIERVEDEASGLAAWIIIDRTRGGLTAGGLRRAPYETAEEAIAEGKRLAARMSLKLAAGGLPAGGAKAVILDHDDLDVPEAYRALGRRIDEMDPPYLCGPDIGTGETELRFVREVTDRVNPGANDPAERTAAGVAEGIQASLDAVEDEVGLPGSRIIVQGFGAVGSALARRLRQRGASVRVTDLDPAARSRARGEGFELVAPDQAYEEACTVFAPCAVSGVVTEAIAERLPARIVCGSANLPLASPEAGRILHERGIAYAPDVLVNVGAVAEGVLTRRKGRSKQTLDEVEEIIASIGPRVRDVIEASREEDVPPDDIVARRWA